MTEIKRWRKQNNVIQLMRNMWLFAISIHLIKHTSTFQIHVVLNDKVSNQ